MGGRVHYHPFSGSCAVSFREVIRVHPRSFNNIPPESHGGKGRKTDRTRLSLWRKLVTNVRCSPASVAETFPPRIPRASHLLTTSLRPRRLSKPKSWRSGSVLRVAWSGDLDRISIATRKRGWVNGDFKSNNKKRSFSTTNKEVFHEMIFCLLGFRNPNFIMESDKKNCVQKELLFRVSVMIQVLEVQFRRSYLVHKCSEVRFLGHWNSTQGVKPPSPYNKDSDPTSDMDIGPWKCIRKIRHDLKTIWPIWPPTCLV